MIKVSIFKYITGLALTVLFNVPTSVFAITIDECDSPAMEAAVSAGSPLASAGGAVSTSIGKARSMREVYVSGLAGLQGRLRADSGVCSFSEDANLSAYGRMWWDGNGDTTLNPAGLGGINLKEDGSTKFMIEILSYDLAVNFPLTLTVYDSRDPLGERKSSFSFNVLPGAPFPKTINIPFAQFEAGGSATPGLLGYPDLTKVGAIELTFNGASLTDADLILDYIITDGTCRLAPAVGGDVIDVCNICGGNGTSCLGCDGVPFSGKTIDICNVCGATGTSCLGCDSLPFSGKTVDQCGICGGDGKSCLGCDGVVSSKKVVDRCNVCGGDGNSCLQCSTINTSELSNVADQESKRLLQANRKAARLAVAKTKDATIIKTIKALLVTSNNDMVVAWTAAWQPHAETKYVVTTCKNTTLCTASTKYTSNLTTYQNGMANLKNDSQQLLAIAKKVGVSKAAISDLSKAMNLHYAKGLSSIAQIPTGESTC